MLVQQTSELKEEILKLKKEKDVVILAHNYQIPEVQDVADFIGDSLGLSRQAAKVPQKTILFCGVNFMAETAAIISPQKKVLLPDLEAGCSLSDSITVDELRNWKKQHPDWEYILWTDEKADDFVKKKYPFLYHFPSISWTAFLATTDG